MNSTSKRENKMKRQNDHVHGGVNEKNTLHKTIKQIRQRAST